MFLGIVFGLAILISSLISSSSSSGGLFPELLNCNPITIIGTDPSADCTGQELSDVLDLTTTENTYKKSHYYVEYNYLLNGSSVYKEYQGLDAQQCFFANPPPWDENSALADESPSFDSFQISIMFIDNIGNYDACNVPMLPQTNTSFLQRLRSSTLNRT